MKTKMTKDGVDNQQSKGVTEGQLPSLCFRVENINPRRAPSCSHEVRGTRLTGLKHRCEFLDF